MQAQDLDKRFSPPFDHEVVFDQASENFKMIAKSVYSLSDDSRAYTIFLEKLEDSYMWAIKAIREGLHGTEEFDLEEAKTDGYIHG